MLERSVEATGKTLGPDAAAYARLIEPLVERWEKLFADLLAPPHFFDHPLAAARFAPYAFRPAAGLARARFRGSRARGLFAGLAAHSVLPLESAMTAAFGLMFAISGHAVGWPFPRGGSQRIADAMASYLRSLGGEILTSRRVSSLEELPRARAVLLDVTPRQLLGMAGDRFSAAYRRKLEQFRYGPGVFKTDYALDGPIPWKDGQCARAGTVHLGGTLEEIAESERSPAKGAAAERPFVLLAQQSLFDGSRAPAGKHTAWAYCHVPNGSTVDMTARIEAQIERFAPGFRERMLARHVMGPAALEARNANYIGGDIGGGSNDLFQFLTRPFPRLNPYSDGAPWSVPVLVFHAARRRRPRHVRIPRGARGFAGGAEAGIEGVHRGGAKARRPRGVNREKVKVGGNPPGGGVPGRPRSRTAPCSRVRAEQAGGGSGGRPLEPGHVSSSAVAVPGAGRA